MLVVVCCCELFDVGWLLFVCRCALLFADVCCSGLLFVVCCLWFVARRCCLVLFVVVCYLFFVGVCNLLFVVGCRWRVFAV